LPSTFYVTVEKSVAIGIIYSPTLSEAKPGILLPLLEVEILNFAKLPRGSHGDASELLPALSWVPGIKSSATKLPQSPTFSEVKQGLY
jgi:hypothetical protein